MKITVVILAATLALLSSTPLFASGKPNSICGRKIELPGWHAKNRLVIFGEVHGTNEMPGYFSDVICNYAMSSTANNSVLVMIELQPQFKPGFDQYLKSRGTPEDKKALVNDKMWKPGMQDGRTSIWLVNFMEKIRKLNSMNKTIEVVPFVDYRTFHQIKGEKNIDDMYAEKVNHYFNNTDKTLVAVLVGNVHAGYLNSGNSMVDKLQTSFSSYFFSDEGGSVWNCKGRGGKPLCKAWNSKASHGEPELDAFVLTIDEKKSFQGYINVGKTTASLPAVDVLLSSPSN